MLRAVIFDFDGVIADDERLHLAGFQHALAALDISVSEAQYFERYLGFDDRDGFVAILEDNDRSADDATVRRLMAAKERAFRELVDDRVRIFPGVRELLASLRAGDDPIATAIGSGALRSEVLMILEVAGLRELFDAIVAADDVSIGKPHPETFLTACSELSSIRADLAPAECLVIEDSVGGLESGRGAGMTTVAVTNSYAAAELEADLIVTSLEQLDRHRLSDLVGDP